MKEADIEWTGLGFGYVPTDYNVRCYYRNGKWGEIEVSSSETIEMHIAATALHLRAGMLRRIESLPRQGRGKCAYSAPSKTPAASRNRHAAS